MHIDQQSIGLFRSQGGVASREQLLALNYSARQVVGAGGLPRPQHEVKIFDRWGKFVAQTDSFWPNGYVHMYDGFDYHRSRRAQTERDMEQRATMRSLGLIVDEFSSRHVFYDPAYVLGTSREGYSRAQQTSFASDSWNIG